MQIIATQRSTRQAPRKVGEVARAVRKLALPDAIHQLGVIERRAAVGLLKVIRQAIANAQHNHGLTLDQLTLKEIKVSEGSRLKRFRAVSRGRAHSITKRTSHIRVVLESTAS